ncbi:MAG: response regulator transcription factor [Caldilineales bacterium]
MATHILFVGRQPDTYAPLWRQLLLGNMQIAFAASLTRALREMEQIAADVIILDAMSLRSSAEPLTRTLRQHAPTARIILVTNTETATGYSYDYVLFHPITWQKLLKVTEEALTSKRRQVLVKGPFVLDLVERTIVGPSGEERLTAKLFGLLALLMNHAGSYISRNQIMQEIWHTSYLEDTRTLDVHMSWLRRLIEPDPKNPVYIRTKRGMGYAFQPYPINATGSAETAEESTD